MVRVEDLEMPTNRKSACWLTLGLSQFGKTYGLSKALNVKVLIFDLKGVNCLMPKKKLEIVVCDF